MRKFIVAVAAAALTVSFAANAAEEQFFQPDNLEQVQELVAHMNKYENRTCQSDVLQKFPKLFDVTMAWHDKYQEQAWMLQFVATSATLTREAIPEVEQRLENILIPFLVSSKAYNTLNCASEDGLATDSEEYEDAEFEIEAFIEEYEYLLKNRS